MTRGSRVPSQPPRRLCAIDRPDSTKPTAIDRSDSTKPTAGRLPDAAPPRDPRRALGRLGEGLAAAHLERRGFLVLARNVRTRHGEIDLVAFDGRTLAFVEVKTRRLRGPAAEPPSPGPLDGLRVEQRLRLRRLAGAWLSEAARPPAREIRFDAIGVLLGSDLRLLRLDHLEGAW